jgi:flagellar motor switch protein FliN
METDASRLFAEGYLAGFFDMVTTMVGEECGFTLNDVSALDPDGPRDLAATHGARMQAKTSDGSTIALLFPAVDTYEIATSFLGEGPAPQDPVADADLSMLQEVYEPCLGAGVSFFKEKYGKVIALQDIEVLPGGAETAEALSALFPGDAWLADFHYRIPSATNGQAALLFSAGLESVIPPEAVAEAKQAQEGSGSQAAVNDILDQAGLPAAGSAPAARPAEPPPPNLDIILDIRLEVKARLGRVQMPIGEILAIGPGSIIEVGHIVDEPIELLVNDKLIARGDVVVVDEKFGLRITEIISPKERIESLR